MGLMELNERVLPVALEDRELIRAIEHGLPVVPRPYREIARQLGTTEAEVMRRLQLLFEKGAIKRYGIVVRHRELGYRANGMVVWDVPDDRVDDLGQCIGRFPCVTLCYRRPRRLPDWPYNLFTMVHGRNREEVGEMLQDIIERCELQDIDHTVLFSKRRFKQRGASYASGKSRSSRTIQPAAALQLVKPE